MDDDDDYYYAVKSTVFPCTVFKLCGKLNWSLLCTLCTLLCTLLLMVLPRMNVFGVTDKELLEKNIISSYYWRYKHKRRGSFMPKVIPCIVSEGNGRTNDAFIVRAACQKTLVRLRTWRLHVSTAYMDFTSFLYFLNWLENCFYILLKCYSICTCRLQYCNIVL